jgi:hypothetical protein
MHGISVDDLTAAAFLNPGGAACKALTVEASWLACPR